ncbi:hypothetical protein AO260_29435 [Pseudomonas sp. ABAC21]|nr:hypothetical protein AO260_29435 [Pseudomonas sp. ABAC21]
MEINLVSLGGYITIAKDLIVAVVAVVTGAVALNGLRVWKRDLVGKESYEAAKALLYQSHAAARASDKMRYPIREHERTVFSKEQIDNMTEGERWRISEANAYRNRIKEYSEGYAGFYEALLNFRVIAGSRVFFAFLPFQRALERPLDAVNFYLAYLDDFSVAITVESPDTLLLREFIYKFDEDLDHHSLSIGEAREKGELFLLPYLHRKSISN